MIYRKETLVPEGKPNLRGGKGTTVMTQLSPELPLHTRVYSLIRLAPGTSIGYHLHEKETELFYFLEGEGVADDNGEKVKVYPGDVMVTGGGKGHAMENEGDEDLLMLAVIVTE